MSLVRQRLRRDVWCTALAVLCMTPVALPETVRAQGGGDRLLEDITSAFAQGDSRALLQQSAERVEVSLFEVSTLFSRGQAMYVLDAFFREFPPRQCVLREPVRTNDSWFTAGRYWHDASEEPLRIYVGLRHNGEQWELREIRIDEQRLE